MMQKGISNLLLVIVIAFVGTTVVALIQSRLLLEISRQRTFSDAILSTYDAESEINSILVRLVNYNVNVDSLPDNLSLSDGTTLNIEASEDVFTNTQHISLTATRPYAVTKLELNRVTQISEESAPDVDIILGLDCTISMNDTDGDSVTRISELKKVVLNFLQAIKDSPYKDKIHLGISTFGINVLWVNTNGNIEITPENNIDIDTIIASVNSRFGTTQGSSTACNNIMSYTSIGSPFAFAHEYFQEKGVTDHQQIEIVITDGQPNSRGPQQLLHPFSAPDPLIPATQCVHNVFCPEGLSGFQCIPPNYGTNIYHWSCFTTGSDCVKLAKDFLACSLATTSQTFESKFDFGTYAGIRDPQTKAYIITVYATPDADAENIFNTFATKYYDAGSENELNQALTDIFQSVQTSMSTITIRRVVQ